MLADALQARSVGVNQEDVSELDRLPPAVRERKTGTAVRGEGDPAAVRRPGRPEVPAGARCQRLCATRLQVERPQVCGAIGPRRHEHEALTIRREGGLIVVRGTLGETLEICAVRPNSKEIGRSGPFGREDDPRAVRRPGRVVIDVWCRQQRMLVAAVRVGDEQADLPWNREDPREEHALRWRVGDGGRRKKRERQRAQFHRSTSSIVMFGGRASAYYEPIRYRRTILLGSSVRKAVAEFISLTSYSSEAPPAAFAPQALRRASPKLERRRAGRSPPVE